LDLLRQTEQLGGIGDVEGLKLLDHGVTPVGRIIPRFNNQNGDQLARSS
jgi:hypothetical protein